MDTGAIKCLLDEARLSCGEGSIRGAIRFYREFFKTARFSLRFIDQVQNDDESKEYILSLINEAKREVRAMAKEKPRSC